MTPRLRGGSSGSASGYCAVTARRVRCCSVTASPLRGRDEPSAHLLFRARSTLHARISRDHEQVAGRTVTRAARSAWESRSASETEQEHDHRHREHEGTSQPSEECDRGGRRGQLRTAALPMRRTPLWRHRSVELGPHRCQAEQAGVVGRRLTYGDRRRSATHRLRQSIRGHCRRPSIEASGLRVHRKAGGFVDHVHHPVGGSPGSCAW